MSYFVPFIDATGMHVPTREDLMEYFEEGYRNIFGADLYLGEDSQDYQMMALYAKTWEDLSSVLLDVYNSRNPDWATAETLDGLCAINGIARKSASASTAKMHLTGTPGASVGSGNTVRDASGFSWVISGEITFDDDGNADADAVCMETGAIAAPAGTINIIESPSYDWFTATNVQDAVIGNEEETDIELRTRRRQAVALSARGTLVSLNDALINAKGVKKVRVLENSGVIFDPKTRTDPHCVHAIVQGGDDSEIGELIYLNKAPGVGTNGAMAVSYRDIYGENVEVRFSRPETKPVKVKIELMDNGIAIDSKTVASVKQAVVKHINAIGIGDILNVRALYSVFYSNAAGAFVASGIYASDDDWLTQDESVIEQDISSVFSISVDDVSVEVAE